MLALLTSALLAAAPPPWQLTPQRSMSVNLKKTLAPPVAPEDPELARKRLPPGVFIPAAAGGALIAGGVTLVVMAQFDEDRLARDLSITRETELRQLAAQGKLHQTLGLSMIGVGALSLASACVLLYSGLVPRHPTALLLPLAGGGAAVSLQGAF